MHAKFNLPFTVKDYILTSYISRGTYGTVYRATSMRYNMEFAVKVISYDMNSTKETFNQEIEVLKHLNHPNIIKIYDCFFEDSNFFMVLELCSKSILDVLNENKIINDAQFNQYAREIIAGIKACHQKHIAHRDLKPANILLDDTGRVKLVDFGLSSLMADKICAYCGTQAYLAPEVIQRKEFDPYAADIWALGVVLYQMKSGVLPWKMNSPKALFESIDNVCVPENDEISPELYHIILQILQKDPSKRLSITAIENLAIFHSNVKDDVILATPRKRSSFNKVNHGSLVIPSVFCNACINRRNSTYGYNPKPTYLSLHMGIATSRQQFKIGRRTSLSSSITY